MKKEDSETAISVIIPVYNAERYIAECLDTVLGQSFGNIEVICVDDGSTDGTIKKLNDYKEKDKRVKVVHQDNKNAGAARNVGLKLAVGKYVIFLDADDFFEKDMFKKMFEWAELYKTDVVVVNSDMYYDDTGEAGAGSPFETKLLPKKKVFSGSSVDKLFLAFVGWSWDKMFLRSFIIDNKLKFQEQKSTNDLYFVYSALIRARKISVLYDVLAHHRCNVKTSISMNREKSWECSHLALMKLKKQLISWNIYDEKMRRDFANYALTFTLWQFETLKGVAQVEFYNAFRNDWIKKYDLLEEEKFFYNKDEYNKLKNIRKYDYNEYFNNRVFELLFENQALKNEVQLLKNQNSQLVKSCQDLTHSNKILKDQNDSMEKGIQEIKQSGAYKTGMAMTSIPRAVRRVFIPRK